MVSGRRKSRQPFVHLRSHSAFSILEGAIQIPRLKEICLKNKMPALALTDTNNMFGALEFSETLAKAGIQPICGLTLSVRINCEAKDEAGEADGTVALLASSEAGYLNLMKLTSSVWLDTPSTQNPCVDLDMVFDHSEGLILLTGGLEGCVNKYIVNDHKEQAFDVLTQMKQHFGDRLYIELQRHGLADEYKAETVLLDWAYENDVAIVATHQPFFEHAEHHRSHDALLCISQSTYLSVKDRRAVTRQHYFMRSDEMSALFADLPEAIENTRQIAKRCSYRPLSRNPILPRFPGNSNLSEAEELALQAKTGLRQRLEKIELAAPEEEYYKRLDFELQVITQMGFPGYFLIVADFIRWSKEQGIAVGPGRGSGAGSVVAWALTITGLDPIRFGLLFERFLNPERVSMPDFDIDFCQERRGEVIEYVLSKYGSDRVAQIITFGTLQPRAALRDVGRVMQLPLGQIDRLAKMVPNNPTAPVTLSEAIKSEARLRQARDEDEAVATLLSTAMEIEGLVRNASTHAAGVVIGDRPLVELTPLYLDPRSNIPATQFNMKWVEKAGLVKFDFLGLKTLTVIERAVKYIKQSGVDVDIDALPLDDAATYELLRKADTVGVFQLESAGMRDTLRKAKPDCFEDIIAIIALYRPGPMDNIPKFVACKFKQEEPIHLHDMITPVVADTYGVIIYQEQVMQIAQVLSGYSLGEADLLRRAMGKKIKAEMQAQRARFVEGAVKNGVTAQRANEIFDIVDKFAGYGFNKSHSAAYALIAYQTAWLKAHYPVEFLAASMSLDMTNTDKLAVFVQDAIQHKITVSPPDVNKSLADFDVADGEILYALGAVRNIGHQAMEHIVAAREDGGEFTDLYDFADRVDPSFIGKRAIENLARAGAFRSIEPNCRNAVAAAGLIQSASTAAAEGRKANQASLFGEELKDFGRLPLPDLKPWSHEERMQNELSSIGFYLSGHPLDEYSDLVKKLNITLFGDAFNAAGHGHNSFRMFGVVRRRQERVSARSGKRFAYVLFSDPQGDFEVMASAKILEKFREQLEPGKIWTFRVKAENKNGDIRFFLENLHSIEEVQAIQVSGIVVFVDNSKVSIAIAEALGNLQKKRDQAVGDLHIVTALSDGRKVKLDTGRKFPIGRSAQSVLQSIAGVQSVVEIEKTI